MKLETIIQCLVYIMYIINVDMLINAFVDKGRLNKWSWFLGSVFISGYFIYESFIDDNNNFSKWLKLIIFISLIITMYLTILSAHKKEPFKILYVMLLYITIDGLITPLLNMIFYNFIATKYLETVNQGIYLIFNLLFFIVFKKYSQDKLDEIKMSVGLLPKKLFIVILSYIALLSFLCAGLHSSEVKPIDYKLLIIYTKILVIPISIASIIIMFFLIINSISKFYYQSSNALLNKQLDLQVKYYEKIEQMANDTKKFRHDYKNHMTCLHSLLDKDKSEEAMEYLESISNHPTMKLSSFNSGNPIADAILNDKASIAKADNCSLKFTGVISERISAFDICTILANALDNSIEACRKITTASERAITVNCALKNDIQVICISNPSVYTDPALKTTKENKENHGFGLYNIRKTVETLDGTMNISQTSPNFVLDVMFKLPEIKNAG